MSDNITLRDYFIAHAPAEPQPWFEPQVPSAPKGPVWEGEPRTAEERKEIDGWQEGFYRTDDMTQPRAKEFVVALEAQKRALSAYYIFKDRERYIHWPAAWADAILKARQS